MRHARLLAPLAGLAVVAGVVVGPTIAADPAPATTESGGVADGAPPAPASITARPAGRSSLALTWPQAPGADSYWLVAKDVATGAVVGPVPGVGVAGEVPGLTIGHQYVPGIESQNGAGVSDLVWGPPVTVLADTPPEAVTNFTATPSTVSTLVTLRWTAAAGGIQPDTYAVTIITAAGAQVGSGLSCDFPCTTRTVQGLEPGTYFALIAPVSLSAGVGFWNFAGPFTVVDGCADGGACVTVDAGTERGPAALVAQGLSAGLWDVDPTLLQPLHLQNVRHAAAWTHDIANFLGARMTWLLSNSWYDQAIASGGPVPRPWADYENYSNWAAGTALGLSMTRPVAYIDIQNEPYADYFPDDPHPAVDPDRVAEQLKAAADGIRWGDPTVKVVGPSFGSYSETQMRAFLDAAVRRGLKLDAINWHELSPAGGSVDRIPVDIIEHVAQVRAMLDQRPSLGTPEIHVNEYTNVTTANLAGWGVGFIAAVERSGMTLAMRSCWGPVDCDGGAELIDAATGGTYAPYWVHRYYAEQTGDRVVSMSSNANVSSFATRDGDDVRIMVGRHQTCLPAVNPACYQNIATGPAFDVPVTVTGLPAGVDRQVVVQRIPATAAFIDGPTEVTTQTMPTTPDGTLAVVLPQVADGEAYTVTVTPPTEAG
jgi:hypothetical protein